MSADVITKPHTRKARTKAAKPDGENVPEALKQERPAAAPRKRMLLVASSKGGSGKTMSALNLAVQAVHSGLRVATVDLDRQETLTKWATRRPDEAPVIDHYTIPMHRLAEGLAEVEAVGDIDLIIVDTPPGVEDHPGAVRLLLARADFCLVPTNQAPADLDSVTEWMRMLKRENVPAAFMLNRTKRQTKSFERAKLHLVRSGNLCPIDVRDLEDIAALHAVGVGLREARGARGQDDIEGVWAYVRAQLRI
jgi:chromosome partitioning protein